MRNIGESVLILGILYLVYLGMHFIILLFLLYPIFTWTYISHDKEAKKLLKEEQRLKNRKLELEIKHMEADRTWTS